MKKILLFVFVICVFSATLCSCNRLESSTSKKNEGAPSESVETTLILWEVEPIKGEYPFDFYQEIEGALIDKTQEKYKLLREEQYNFSTEYQSFLSKFSSGDFKIAIPQTNDKAMPFQNDADIANITLFTDELYHLPWIWYRCLFNDQKLVVSISYLDIIYPTEDDQNIPYTQILKSIAPDAPSPENYQKYESYEAIYEKTIVLKNGVSVVAMVSELKDSSSEYVMFYHDGLLVVLKGESELFSEDFWKSFDIVYDCHNR